LDVFKAHKEIPVVGNEVGLVCAVGRVTGYLAHPDTTTRLPAVLLIPDESGLTAWMKENARDLAGIGYVVLAVEVRPTQPLPAGQPQTEAAAWSDESTLAQLSAAARWLRRRPEVLPQRLGVVGWSRGGGQALALAANRPLQACITCDGPVTDEPAVLAGLRGTPVLGVFAGKGEEVPTRLPAFCKALERARILNKFYIYQGVQSGFMGPPEKKVYAREAAERAWVEVYEFLGKHVEDAPEHPRPVSLTRDESAATIADIMLAVSSPTGLRGTLIQGLEQQPANQRQWERLRANAAVVAEAGRWLRARMPPKGARDHWQDQCEVYSAAAEDIVTAASKHDYAGALHGLRGLAACCMACHTQHR
jgi:carboxymethylenebutenolidase